MKLMMMMRLWWLVVVRAGLSDRLQVHCMWCCGQGFQLACVFSARLPDEVVVAVVVVLQAGLQSTCPHVHRVMTMRSLMIVVIMMMTMMVQGSVCLQAVFASVFVMTMIGG